MKQRYYIIIKTKKFMKKEIIIYFCLAVLLLLSMNQVKYSLVLLIIFTFTISLLYLFAFKHWFEDESNNLVTIAGRIIMAQIPMAVFYISRQYPGFQIVSLYVFLSLIGYWIFRYVRKTHFRNTYQFYWLLFLSSLPFGIVIFLI